MEPIQLIIIIMTIRIMILIIIQYKIYRIHSSSRSSSRARVSRPFFSFRAAFAREPGEGGCF